VKKAKNEEVHHAKSIFSLHKIGVLSRFMEAIIGMAWGQENDIKMDDGRGMRADD
jgi:hypothetical protein